MYFATGNAKSVNTKLLFRTKPCSSCSPVPLYRWPYLFIIHQKMKALLTPEKTTTVSHYSYTYVHT